MSPRIDVINNKWWNFKGRISRAEPHLIDSEIARLFKYINDSPILNEFVNKLRSTSAYSSFSAELWLAGKEDSNFSIGEEQSLAEQLKVLEWVVSMHQNKEAYLLVKVGQKLSLEEKPDRASYADLALDFIFRPFADYIDIEFQTLLRQPDGEEPSIDWVDLDNSRNIFVVHGRNIKAKNELEKFLRAIDLHPIEWSEARRFTDKPNPFTNEIVQAAFENARVILVLLTPDDFAYMNPIYLNDGDEAEEKVPTLQPRQNVLF